MSRLNLKRAAVAAMAVFVSASVTHAVSTANLVGYWAMEEGVGLVAGDSSGFGRDGALSPANVANGPQWINSGLAAPNSTQALRFDGNTNDDQINVTGFKGITGTADRTVSAWIRTELNDPQQNMGIVSWGQNSGGQKWTFRIQNSNGTDGTIRVENNGGRKVGSTVVTDGEWHHVAVTWANDGSPNINDALLYVDGSLEAISNVQGRALNTASTADVRIGADFNANHNWLGDIDEVSIFAEALSADDIADLFRNGISQGVPEPTTAILALMGVGFAGIRRKRRLA